MTQPERTAHVIEMPLRTSHRAAGHEISVRRGIIVEATDGEHTGWGEFGELPGYAPETLETALAALSGSPITHSNPMAVAAARCAELDLEAHRRLTPLVGLLGGTPGPVTAGAVVGRHGDVAATLAEAALRIGEGYRKLKVKIGPGFDVEPLAALRDLHPSTGLAVDANGAYEPGTVPPDLAALDLLYLEQPYAPWVEWKAFAELRSSLAVPICLDESITGLPTLRSAIAAAACDVINLKAAPLAGLRTAVELHDLARDAGLGLVAGGLLETGVGRAAALALARLPGFTYPADLGASNRYWERDIIEPGFRLENGVLAVPNRPGLGITVDRDALEAHTVSQHSFPTRTPG